MISYFLFLKRSLKNVFYQVRGEPIITDGEISGKLITERLNRPDPTILDIGCNDGLHTQWFLSLFKDPMIFSFEPDPRALSRFKSRIGESYNVHLFEIAISDRNEETIFYQSDGFVDNESAKLMPSGWDCSGSLRKPKNHLKVYPQISFEKTIKVQTKRLDTWCEEQNIRAIDLIWMDVQGAEIDVIRGGQKILKSTRFIYSEYSNKELYQGQASLRDLLKELNYFSVIKRFPNDILIQNTLFHTE